MYYNKFTIQNFKGIRNLTIDLDKQSNNVFTLVGLNESGKSTILEAMSLLNTVETPDNVHDFIPKSLRSNFTGHIKIHSQLTLEKEDFEALTVLLTKHGYKNLDIPTTLKVFKRFDYKDSENEPEDFIERIYQFTISGQKGKSKKVTDINYKNDLATFDLINKLLSEKLIPAILYYPNFLFDFPEKIYLKKQPSEKDEQPLYREVIGDILNSIDTQLTIEKHLLERAMSGKLDSKRALDSTLLKMNAKVTKTVFGAWDTLFDSKGKEIIITINADEDGEFFLEFNLKENYNYFQISERSLGFRWFFTFLLFTEFRKNRVSKSGEILFMLDEPASNLHSTAQKNLLKTFEAISDKAKLIYTTHSHHLINPKWLSGAYIVRNKSINYDSEFDYDSESADIEVIQYKQFVSSHPNQKSFFQPILDTLDYQPGLIEEVPGIIITEGKNDYYILKYFSFFFGDDKYKSLHIYPGGGANRNSSTIALYLGWGKPFLIFLDSDKGGISAETTYLKEFGKSLDQHIKTFQDVCDTFTNFAIEDLFSEDDRLMISKLYDDKLSAFKKSALNTAIENLYITNEKINFSAQTQVNFRKVLDFLVEHAKTSFT